MVKFSIKCRMFDFSYGITEQNMGWSNKVYERVEIGQGVK